MQNCGVSDSPRAACGGCLLARRLRAVGFADEIYFYINFVGRFSKKREEDGYDNVLQIVIYHFYQRGRDGGCGGKRLIL